MSRKLFAFMLEELKLIRIICTKKGCGGIAEMTVEQLGGKSMTKCPVCEHDIFLGNDQSPLQKLAKSISLVQHEVASGRVQVEFVLPDATDAAK